MSSSNELIVLEEKTAIEAFSDKEALISIIGKVREVVEGFEHDLSTDASRRRTISLARKVASFKVKINDFGKKSVADLKEKTKQVDALCKFARDELDALRDEARRPVTEWEAEQEKIKAQIAAEKIKAQIETDHELALTMNEAFDINAENERKILEAKRLEEERLAEERRRQRDEQLKQQAREEAEKQAKAEKERLEKQRLEAIKRAERAEKEKADAIKAAEEKAKQAAEDARKRELARIEAEKQRAKLEEEERQANISHRKAVNKAAIMHLVSIGISREDSIKVVTSIMQGEVPNVTIKY